ncbi:MAG: glycosyltransferase [Paludibacteraceae bacterium]|nr:glycosyltransferase [Paludibacteraceae bacterium]
MSSNLDFKFSVCMSVYKNDRPEYVDIAIQSIFIKQTVKPNEIVLVVDGPISMELESLIDNYSTKYSEIFTIIKLEKNQGLGNALRVAVEKVKYDWVARMDSDDIAAPDRFEKQKSFLQANLDVDIVGGQITEFIDVESNIVGLRNVPLLSADINVYIKARCPFNHMTVMFRKDKILAVGNYIDWHYNEDYFLWIRMFLAGCQFANLPETLVNVRVGKEMYQRRGGWKYFLSEAKLQKYMFDNDIIGIIRFAYNVLGRFVIQVLMPNKLRGFVFQKLFRVK